MKAAPPPQLAFTENRSLRTSVNGKKLDEHER